MTPISQASSGLQVTEGDSIPGCELTRCFSDDDNDDERERERDAKIGEE